MLKIVSDEKIIVTGDSRFDQILYRTENQSDNSYLNQFNNESRYIILGSIDSVDLTILKDAMNNCRGCKYIIVPHEVDSDNLKNIELMLDK